MALSVQDLSPQIEQARRALRQGHPADAVALLNACGAARDDDPHFHGCLTYAREWAAAEAGRRRAGDPTKLSHAELQSVLAWLCADEAEHARWASEAGDFPAAAEFWHHALRLDRRFTRAALCRARAIHEACRAEHRPPTARTLAASWSATVGHLAAAEQLAGQARDDPALAAEGRRLLDRIRAERERAIKLAAFWRCFARWEGHASIAGNLDRLVCRYGYDDPDIGPLLADLAGLVEAAGRT